jgi:proteasome lid subunit RPN8/RPN11
MIITTDQLAQLIALARRDAPNETCGIIAGKNNRALKIYSLPNDASNPRIEYNAEPRALIAAFREIEANGWEHLAIFHSHPATPAYPSPTDIARAFYPDAIYILISLMHPEQAMVRAFQIREGRVSEITLEVEDEPSRENPRRSARRTNRSHSGRAVAALSRRRPATGKARRQSR